MSDQMNAADFARMRRKGDGHNKYNAKRTEVDGITFDSKMESRRYIQLKQLEKGGVIRDLELQPRYPLTSNDVLICTYVADFRYWDNEREREVVEDVKGKITREYRIKKKWMLALYDIEVQEVTA
jgi:hypothetical protein